MHNDCTFEKSEVQFVVLKFTKPYKKVLILDANSSPSVFNLIDRDITILWNIHIGQITSSLNAHFIGGVYEMEYFVGLRSTVTVTEITQGNLVKGNNILKAFTNTKYLALGSDYSKLYEIDKRKSTTNVLFLTKPIVENTSLFIGTNVFPVLRYDEFITVINPIKKKINSLIAKTNTHSSDKELSLLSNDVITLMSVRNATNNGDLEGATLLYNNLNNKYKC